MRRSTLKTLSRLHTALYRLTRGLVGRRLVDNDMLLLVTTGRFTGRRHTVPLLYLTEGEALIVIASYGGRDRHPDWWLNLERKPEAEVQVDGKRLSIRAQRATSEEKERLWPRVIDAYHAYADYQARTERDIPVVLLHPIGRGAGAGA
ncbi:MAG: nitroreductase family deazaflavin-dependent oxidoreductase [Acidimicrobiia bacterium]